MDVLLAQLLNEAVPFALPLRRRFRGLDVREGVLIRGPRGWGEFAPFDDYPDTAAARWLGSAVEAAFGTWAVPLREVVEVNAIIPAVGSDDAIVLARQAVLERGCRTVKVKIDGDDPGADEARVAGVRDVLDTVLGRGVGRLRIDANAAWTVDGAAAALRRLSAYGLEYVEQPCRTLAELRELRSRIDVPVAADESIRSAADPASVPVREYADIAICKPAPLGGVAECLRVAERVGLPVVVSGSLDSSVGLAVAVAAAAAMPDLPYACGLGTGALLADDLVPVTSVAEAGVLPVERALPDLERLVAARDRVSPARTAYWRTRIEAAWQAGGADRCRRARVGA
jgi:O-succinylbenzoate synthase